MPRSKRASAILAALVLAIATGPSVVADDVLTESDKGPELLHSILVREADAHFDRWRKEYEERDTPEEIAAYQQRTRAFFLEQIGAFPERTPLNARVTGTIDRGAFRVEKVLFESRPRHYVTAAMFLPDAKKFPPPYPGVLVLCGHADEGKANDLYQRATALLALNGIAALIVDPIGQGERHQIVGGKGSIELVGPTTEHTFAGLGSALIGRNTAHYEIWDAMRAIDYLQQHAEIDGNRIGCMGNSGGGTQTAYVMALDDRIGAAAPSCYITRFWDLLHTIGPQDAEQNIAGQVGFCMDHPDYLMMRAPMPTLICCATKDYFPADGTWESYRDAKRLYGLMGVPEQVDLVENADSHGYKPLLRKASVEWMLRWLAARPETISEPEIAVLTKEEIQCTPAGEVMQIEGARSVFDLNREENSRLAAAREKLWRGGAPREALDQVRRIAGIRKLDEIPEPEGERRGTGDVDGLACEKMILRREDGMALPALYVPGFGGAADKPLLFLSGSGLASDETKQAIKTAVKERRTILAVDVRGIGETRPEKRDSWYNAKFGYNGRNATVAYLLGRSLTGMRAEDILVCAEFLRTASGGKPVEIVATDELGPAAVHAAALEPQLFGRVELIRSLSSYTSLVDTAMTEDQWIQVVHGALRVYDLPDLVRTLGNKLKITDPRDPR